MSRPSISGIYVILNTRNSKIYLGQSTDLWRRWRQHKARLNRGNHDNTHLQAAWNKYGAKAFKFKILERCDVSRLDEREQHYLDIYVAKAICYNMAVDASSPMRGRRLSPEHKRKIGEANKGKKRRTVQYFSPERRAAISEANKNRPPISEETRLKLSNSHKGKTVSDETRRKLSEANKRRWERKRNPSDE